MMVLEQWQAANCRVITPYEAQALTFVNFASSLEITIVPFPFYACMPLSFCLWLSLALFLSLSFTGSHGDVFSRPMFAQGCSSCPLPHTRLLVPRQLLTSTSVRCEVLTFYTHADATALIGSDVLNMFALVKKKLPTEKSESECR